MSYTTQQDILDFVEDNNVKFVRFAFCDIFGFQKNIAVLASDLPKALEDGVCFDGSAIAGFMHVEESDLVLRPDLSTMTILPWRTAEGRVMQFFCDVEKPDNTPFGGNCRGFLRDIILCQCQQSSRSLGRRNIEIKHTESHHRTTADNLLRILFKSSRHIQQFLITHTDGYPEVPWIRHSITGHRDNALHQRASFCNRSVNSNHGIYIVYNASHIRGQHGRIDLTTRCGIDQLTFRTLRVLGLQCLDRDLRIIFGHLF